MIRERYCSDTCKRADCDDQIAAVINSGQQVLELKDGRILCNLCGWTGRVVGTHMKLTHGFDPGHKMTLLERQANFNLPMATRLAADDLRKLWRVLACKLRAEGKLIDGQRGDLQNEKSRALHKLVRRSPKQIKTFRERAMTQGAVQHHLLHIKPTTCKRTECLRIFTQILSRHNGYCSRDCYYLSRWSINYCVSCTRPFEVRLCDEARLTHCPEHRQAVKSSAFGERR